MKNLFLILLIVFATCDAIEASFVDNRVSEKGKGKPIKLPIVPKPTSAYTSRSSSKHTTRPINKYATKVANIHSNSRPTTRYVAKVATKVVTPAIPKKTVKDLLNLPVKGINGLFKGKQGEAFRKLPEVIKKAIAWLKQNNLWGSFVKRFKNIGEQYDEYCEKFFPEDVCKGTKDFITKNIPE